MSTLPSLPIVFWDFLGRFFLKLGGINARHIGTLTLMTIEEHPMLHILSEKHPKKKRSGKCEIDNLKNWVFVGKFECLTERMGKK